MQRVSPETGKTLAKLAPLAPAALLSGWVFQHAVWWVIVIDFVTIGLVIGAEFALQ